MLIYLIIAIVINALNIFVMVKFKKKPRKFFIRSFFISGIILLVFEVILNIYSSGLDVKGMNILQGFFYVILFIKNTFVLLMIIYFLGIYALMFLITYIILTIYEKFIKK